MSRGNDSIVLDEDGFRPLIALRAADVDAELGDDEVEQARRSPQRNELYRRAIYNNVRRVLDLNKEPIVTAEETPATPLRFRQEKSIRLKEPCMIRSMQDVLLVGPNGEVQVRFVSAVISGGVKDEDIVGAVAAAYQKEPCLLNYSTDDRYEESMLHVFIDDNVIIFERTCTIKRGIAGDSFATENRRAHAGVCKGRVSSYAGEVCWLGIAEAQRTKRDDARLLKRERIILLFSTHRDDVKELLDENVNDSHKEGWLWTEEYAFDETVHDLLFSGGVAGGNGWIELNTQICVPMHRLEPVPEKGLKYTHRRVYQHEDGQFKVVDSTATQWNAERGEEEHLRSFEVTPRNLDTSRSMAGIPRTPPKYSGTSDSEDSESRSRSRSDSPSRRRSRSNSRSRSKSRASKASSSRKRYSRRSGKKKHRVSFSYEDVKNHSGSRRLSWDGRTRWPREEPKPDFLEIRDIQRSRVGSDHIVEAKLGAVPEDEDDAAAYYTPKEALSAARRPYRPKSPKTTSPITASALADRHRSASTPGFLFKRHSRSCAFVAQESALCSCGAARPVPPSSRKRSSNTSSKESSSRASRPSKRSRSQDPPKQSRSSSPTKSKGKTESKTPPTARSPSPGNVTMRNSVNLNSLPLPPSVGNTFLNSNSATLTASSPGRSGPPWKDSVRQPPYTNTAPLMELTPEKPATSPEPTTARQTPKSAPPSTAPSSAAKSSLRASISPSGARMIEQDVLVPLGDADPHSLDGITMRRQLKLCALINGDAYELVANFGLKAPAAAGPLRFEPQRVSIDDEVLWQNLQAAISAPSSTSSAKTARSPSASSRLNTPQT